MDTSKFMDLLIGALKSWTAWFGVLIASTPDWWPLVSDQIADLLGQNAFDKVVRMMGILVIILRFKTTQSVSEKGKPV